MPWLAIEQHPGSSRARFEEPRARPAGSPNRPWRTARASPALPVSPVYLVEIRHHSISFAHPASVSALPERHQRQHYGNFSVVAGSAMMGPAVLGLVHKCSCLRHAAPRSRVTRLRLLRAKRTAWAAWVNSMAFPFAVTIGAQPGPQTEFLRSRADICSYGGAAGAERPLD